jgi:hypothetical protein
MIAIRIHNLSNSLKPYKMDKLTIKGRLKSKTPPFWKKVRKLMITCGAIGGAIIAVPAEHTAWLPSNLGSILLTIGAVGTALASLTVQDQK